MTAQTSCPPDGWSTTAAATALPFSSPSSASAPSSTKADSSPMAPKRAQKSKHVQKPRFVVPTATPDPEAGGSNVSLSRTVGSRPALLRSNSRTEPSAAALTNVLRTGLEPHGPVTNATKSTASRCPIFVMRSFHGVHSEALVFGPLLPCLTPPPSCPPLPPGCTDPRRKSATGGPEAAVAGGAVMPPSPAAMGIISLWRKHKDELPRCRGPHRWAR
mmetsp:Transcript_86834/g.244850  ORF Transcript_86834/g.244850 Transcript_86834/m.244850 type:complete len:217 (+) Transcript_86834:933-1583(+)